MENGLTKTEKELVSFVPKKMWYSLKECCDLKGLNIKTSYNNTNLQPNRGRGEKVGGKKVFRYDSVMKWLFQTDDCL